MLATRKSHADNIPWYLWCQCPHPHSELKPPLGSPGDSPRPTGRSGPGSYEVTAFALAPSAHETLYVASKSGVSVSPGIWCSYNQVPLAFKDKRSGESSSPCQTPRRGARYGLRTLAPVRELLQYNYPPVCGLPRQGVQDFDYILSYTFYYLIVVSSLYLDLEFFLVWSNLFF